MDVMSWSLGSITDGAQGLLGHEMESILEPVSVGLIVHEARASEW